MSTRVGLMIAFTWLVLAARTDGQVTRDVAGRQTGHSEAPGADTESWLASTGSNEQISNAPRAVSNAEATVGGQTRSTPNGQAPRAVSDSAETLAPMPLPPRSKRQSRQTKSTSGTSSGRALLTVISSLAIVLAVFFAFVWLTRSAAPKGMAPLSKDVVESLGRAPLLGRQQMQLIEIGNKLILLSVTATGADTLTEITDPAEVDRLAGLCRQAQSGSISDTFRQVLAQASAEPATSPRTSQRQDRRSGSMEPRRA